MEPSIQISHIRPIADSISAVNVAELYSVTYRGLVFSYVVGELPEQKGQLIIKNTSLNAKLEVWITTPTFISLEVSRLILNPLEVRDINVFLNKQEFILAKVPAGKLEDTIVVEIRPQQTGDVVLLPAPIFYN